MSARPPQRDFDFMRDTRDAVVNINRSSNDEMMCGHSIHIEIREGRRRLGKVYFTPTNFALALTGASHTEVKIEYFRVEELLLRVKALEGRLEHCHGLLGNALLYDTAITGELESQIIDETQRPIEETPIGKP